MCIVNLIKFKKNEKQNAKCNKIDVFQWYTRRDQKKKKNTRIYQTKLNIILSLHRRVQSNTRHGRRSPSSFWKKSFWVVKAFWNRRFENITPAFIAFYFYLNNRETNRTRDNKVRCCPSVFSLHLRVIFNSEYKTSVYWSPTSRPFAINRDSTKVKPCDRHRPRFFPEGEGS